jgi:hypothetical protein
MKLIIQLHRCIEIFNASSVRKSWFPLKKGSRPRGKLSKMLQCPFSTASPFNSYSHSKWLSQKLRKPDESP